MSSGTRPGRPPRKSALPALSYAYGIVPADYPLDGVPDGIDGSTVELVEGGGVAALVSQLDAGEYSPERIEASVGEVEWVAPRAEAHDTVVTWAGQPGPVVPLHMWTMFSDRGALSEMLARRGGELRPLLERLRETDEYGLRVFADVGALHAAAAAGDTVLSQLQASAESAGPGQRYLIERKLEGARREAARALATAAANAVYARLGAHAADIAHDTIPRIGAAEAGAILSGAFLVRREHLREFRRELTALITEYEPRGFRFDFTGPWPPYHFAGTGDAGQ